jgi:hypothetical protein
LIATLAIAFTRDNVDRRGGVGRGGTKLTQAVARDELEPDSAAVGHARSALEPVPRPDAAAAREDGGASISVPRGRSTLGSVPRRDPPGARPFEVSDDASEQVPPLRQARTSGRPQN